MERIFKEKHTGLSPNKTIEILKSIYTVQTKLPISNPNAAIIIVNNEQQEAVLKTFNTPYSFWNIHCRKQDVIGRYSKFSIGVISILIENFLRVIAKPLWWRLTACALSICAILLYLLIRNPHEKIP
ncbi:hypothetical protein [Niabella digestorum]|jgi:hypothetical protein|uniref:TPM domain-containing protein n=1 Tax=Niabella digestorum TaxID=3117701 RepID=A0ABU7RCF2_9BACT